MFHDSIVTINCSRSDLAQDKNVIFIKEIAKGTGNNSIFKGKRNYELLFDTYLENFPVSHSLGLRINL